MVVIHYKILLLLICVLSSSALNIRNSNINYYKDNELNSDHCEKPLILTSYIEAGKISEAQSLARVHNFSKTVDVVSYSGFFTVDKKCNSNMFFWYFPSEQNHLDDPVILWLQGGPGGSSMHGLFKEIGPYHLEGTNLTKRQYRWSDKYNLLFIDNPVDTGFSFTDNRTDCFPYNEDDVRKSLYKAVVQFFQLFPKLKPNRFFIFGESYAGKYIPALAYSIYENNNVSETKINLQGLGIGDGVCDPINMINYSSFLYNIGIIGENQMRELRSDENKMIQLIKEEKWRQAGNSWQDLLQKVVNWTYLDIYNFLTVNKPLSPDVQNYLNRKDVKCKIHTGNLTFTELSDGIFYKMLPDMPKTIKPWIEKLIEQYPIMFYNGMLDIVVGVPLTENFIKYLNWSGAEQYAKTNQSIYSTPDGTPYAYGRHYGNLAVIKVRNAGHMVPKDQPLFAYKVLEDFIKGF